MTLADAFKLYIFVQVTLHCALAILPLLVWLAHALDRF